METLRGAVLVVSIFACACVETPAATDARAEAHARAEPSRVAVDNFWLDQQIASFEDYPAPRPKSISLGYAGDTPLSGGITRDTPVMPYGYENGYADGYDTGYGDANANGNRGRGSCGSCGQHP